jgi:hypothetical protein
LAFGECHIYFLGFKFLIILKASLDLALCPKNQ